MGVKLNKETSDVIHVSQMKDGQIAEIISHYEKENIGKIIVQHINELLVLGYVGNETFHLNYNYGEGCDFRVRILKNGETLTITDNE